MKKLLKFIKKLFIKVESVFYVGATDILKEPLEAKKCIGYLPEHPPLYTDMEVLDYLSFVYASSVLRL